MARLDDFNRRIARQRINNYGNSTRFLKEIQSIERLLGTTRPFDSVVRAAYGPLYDIRRMGLDELFRAASGVPQEWMRVTDSLQNFRVPTVAEYEDPLRRLLGSNEAASRKVTAQFDELQRWMQNISTPWLDVGNEMQSVQGVVGLYGIGSALRDLSAYSIDLTDLLRLDLGDWREVTLPEDIEDDPIERASFYEDLGFNTDLATFPNETFEQLITEAGVKTPDISLQEGYYQVLTSEGIEEEGFERTNHAHNVLMRFETHVRKFISEQMEDEIGQNWIKQRVPSDMRSRWEEKKLQESNPDNQSLPLIAYADFPDYVVIICRNDNWRELFESTFERKQSIQESFYRLFPVRIATMHARIITQDDEVYLNAETRRILKAIEGED